VADALQSRWLHRLSAACYIHKRWLIVLAVVAPLLAGGGTIAALHWPYRQAKIDQLLRGVLGCKVQITGYSRTYIPHPGFVATGIHLWRSTPSGDEPLGSVQTFAAEGRWMDLLFLKRRVHLIDITNLHLVVPPGAPSTSNFHQDGESNDPRRTSTQPSSRPSGDGLTPPQEQDPTTFTGPSTEVELLQMHESVLDIRRAHGGFYSLPIRLLEVVDLLQGHAMAYRVDLENPLPDGRVTANGSFGPVDPKDLGKTPVSGEFAFNPINLHSIGDLRGSMAATGKFKGALRAIHAEATSESSDFAIGRGQPTRVHGSIECVVNGTNGDLLISRAQLSSGQTTVFVHGSVAGSHKITEIEFAIAHGRAEDVLRPFMHNQVPVLGPVALHGHAHLDPPGKPFLQRLQVTGSFDVPSERITNTGVENTLSSFSQRMENNRLHRDPNKPADTNRDALSSLRGPALIRNGIVSSPHLTFSLPGANATLHGTYALGSGDIHLTGMLRMDAGISHATTGWKSVLLKLISPFFRREDHSGSKIPIAVTGSPGHYKVAQHLD
jgi:AsmA-like C-terminal region